MTRPPMDAKRRILTALVAGAVLLFLLRHARLAHDEPHRFTQPAMGTIFTVAIHHPDAAAAGEAARGAFALLHSIEAELTRFREDSPVSAINRDPVAEHKVSGALLDCLTRSIELHRFTGGSFDITFLPLYRAWDWRNAPTAAPSAATLEALLARVGTHRIRLDEAAGTVRMEPGMMLDLGGIGKCYAVRRMAESLVASGMADAIVSGGGDLFITAARPHAIGVQHPDGASRGDLAGRILLTGPAAVYTSGDYEQGTVIAGRRYGHIIDPLTGHPAEGLRAVTVISRGTEEIAGLSAGLMAMGAERALRFVEEHQLAALLIDASGEVHLSARFRDRAGYLPEPKE